MRVKRVLMTGDTVGGIWTFTLELARELCDRGIEVCLAAFGGRASEEQNRQVLAIDNLHPYTYDLKLEWMDDPWSDIGQSANILAKLARKFVPDVVHLNSYGHGNVDWGAPVVLTAHSCVASWWEAVRGERLPDSWRRYCRAVEQSIAAAAVVTAPTNAMLDCLNRHYAVMPRRARIIANGLRERASLPWTKQPFVFSAGRLWDEAKNVAAIARLASRLPWPVYLAGGTRNPGGVESAFGGCRMLGSLSSSCVAKWYSRASIYAAPAKYEPFGLAALEAGLAGCALVLGDIPSLRETWHDAALFVTDAELEHALGQLIADAPLRGEYASRAQKRAREFTARNMAAAYLGVYESVVERRYACAS